MQNDQIREGSAPNFCPPTEEGITITLSDDNGDEVLLEFLGLLLQGDSSYGFFFPIDESNGILSSGEVLILEVVGEDEEGQPSEFELVEDELLLQSLYDEFRKATKDLYRFE